MSMRKTLMALDAMLRLGTRIGGTVPQCIRHSRSFTQGTKKWIPNRSGVMAIKKFDPCCFAAVNLQRHDSGMGCHREQTSGDNPPGLSGTSDFREDFPETWVLGGTSRHWPAEAKECLEGYARTFRIRTSCPKGPCK
jgi:hypothetical protein